MFQQIDAICIVTVHIDELIEAQLPALRSLNICSNYKITTTYYIILEGFHYLLYLNILP